MIAIFQQRHLIVTLY